MHQLNLLILRISVSFDTKYNFGAFTPWLILLWTNSPRLQVILFPAAADSQILKPKFSYIFEKVYWENVCNSCSLTF